MAATRRVVAWAGGLHRRWRRGEARGGEPCVASLEWLGFNRKSRGIAWRRP